MTARVTQRKLKHTQFSTADISSARSIAVPVKRYDGTIVAAINIGAHVDRVSTDEMVKRWVARIKGGESAYTICDAQSADFSIVGKFSGIDPLVKTEQGLKRLSEVDPAYQQEMHEARQWIGAGQAIKFRDC